MDDDFAKALIGRLIDEGYEPRSYSGRAMYGARCVGVDLSGSRDLFKLGMDLMRSADGADLVYGQDGWRLESVSTDSMGHGIIAYWECIRWPEGYSPPTTRDAVREEVDEGFGPDGLDALELVCLGDADYQQGLDHCMDKVQAALQDEGPWKEKTT